MTGKTLYLYNSMGRTLQAFTSKRPGKVHLYTCGPTVYNYAHIGNLRAYLFTDTLRRILQFKGYEVLHVMNITDVGHLTLDGDGGEDKMEIAAERESKSIWEIASFYTKAFKEDLHHLNIMRPSIWCYATEHIQEMIHFAQVLHEKGFTYILEDGLYFDTSQVESYGELALLNVEGQQETGRIMQAKGKRNPSDFAVWRFSPKDKQRLMEWRSPWGIGAPGWHLECSCMSIKYLGRHFDIHTGGIDHRQVHHCNEIAQNQAYLQDDTGGVNYWLHNDFLVFDQEKMSKSTDAFIRLQTLADEGIHPLVFRFFVLGANYRNPLHFSIDALLSAKMGLTRLLATISKWKQTCGNLTWIEALKEARYSRGAAFNVLIDSLKTPLLKEEHQWIEKFDAAISQDLNTAKGVSLLFQLTSDKTLSSTSALLLVGVFDLVLGLDLLQARPEDLNLRPKHTRITTVDVESLIMKRNQARDEKDYARADDIRNELTTHGVRIKDTKKGTSWEWSIRGVADIRKG